MLTRGMRIGVYEVTAPLGEGGMGIVVRARDTKLQRDVALKVLPDRFAGDAERLSRFQREAQVLASLNHPNIAQIYGLEESADSRCIVMELVDGETIQERLHRGPISPDDTLSFARQIATALEAAHAAGIAHRDLKSANIKIAANGTVKVLDFGLAKAFAADAASNLTNSPTLLTFNQSQPNVIMGTAAYMSPEQARGHPIDERTDIWAFGCVLFEMLTARQAFEGETVGEILAGIFKGEPDWNRLPADASADLRKLLRRCLQKDRALRFQHAGDLRIEIQEAIEHPSTPAASTPRQTPALWIAATTILFVAAAALAAASLWRPAEKHAAVAFEILPPEKSVFMGGATSSVAVNAGVISPDGATLAFTAQAPSGTVLLWLRPLAATTARSLAGTDGASVPFWSPDSRSIGFIAAGKLKKVEVAGGAPQNLASSILPSSGAWSSEGFIVFSRNASEPLVKISSAGGEPVAVTKMRGASPSFLPDGRHFLYRHNQDSEEAGIYIGSLDSLESKRLLAADAARYAAPGYLLFVQQGTLMAQPFDAKTMALSGVPVRLADSIPSHYSAAAFSASNDGTLTYRSGIGDEALQWLWLDRGGKLVAKVGTAGNYAGVDLSPDGKKIAMHRHEGNGGDVWILDTSRGAASKLTFDASQENIMPIWSPDAASIVFASRRNDKWGLYRKRSDGTGADELLFESDLVKYPFSWSPDGKFIVFGMTDPKSVQDLWLLPLSDRKPTPLLNSPYTEMFAQISPDGRWLAYASNETGRSEIYVKPFPSGDGKWQLSTNGGVFPRWRQDGREVFIETTGGGRLESVAVNGSGATFEAGVAGGLFDARQPASSPAGHMGQFHVYAVSPDGQRFLIPRPLADLEGTTLYSPITVILNWTALLTGTK